jgi:8-oxo-dGTP pyrophosphatase MutT (NUDIX family)
MDERRVEGYTLRTSEPQQAVMKPSHPDPHLPPDRERLADVLAALAADTDYARGALDVLRLLGLVEDRGGSLEPAGEVSALFLHSLRAHLRDGVRFCFDWDDLDAEGTRGVDVLWAAETARARAVPDPTPARVVTVVQSIIKTRVGDEDRYLMQYDRHARRFQPLGGKLELNDHDLDRALRRELAEELALDTAPDLDLCELVLLDEGWRTVVPSATYGVLTHYTFAFFHVVNVQFPIRADDDTCWLTRDDIAQGRTGDGRAISPIYLEALGLARLDGLSLSLE